MINLKPCPFCGGVAKVHTSVNCCTEITCFVACEKCGCQTTVFVDVDYDGMFLCKAVESWNRRKTDVKFYELS